MDLRYFKSRAVRIYTRQDGSLPVEAEIRRAVRKFGQVYYCYVFRREGGTSIQGTPNTAILVFSARSGVDKVIQSWREYKEGSFWQKHDLAADSCGKVGPLDEFFATKVFPRLISKLHGSVGGASGSNNTSQPRQSEPTHPDPEGCSPPAKRQRTEDWGRTSTNATESDNHTPVAGPSRISSATPESPEWMRARIAQLEAELDQVKAERDMAISEQDVIRTAHQAEQRGRREATSQKSAAEAALSRKEAEQNRLRSDLEIATARSSAFSKDVDAWREQFAEVEEQLRLAQSSLDESSNRGEESGEAKAKIKELKSKVKQLKSDLVTTQEQLESTQGSLESMEQKYSSAHEKYKNTKAKLGVYKERLKNEQSLLEKLKDTLTPAAYRSLGTMHETMGALLSAMELPPVREDGNAILKCEPDEESSAET